MPCRFTRVHFIPHFSMHSGLHFPHTPAIDWLLPYQLDYLNPVHCLVQVLFVLIALPTFSLYPCNCVLNCAWILFYDCLLPALTIAWTVFLITFDVPVCLDLWPMPVVDYSYWTVFGFNLAAVPSLHCGWTLLLSLKKIWKTLFKTTSNLIIKF